MKISNLKLLKAAGFKAGEKEKDDQTIVALRLFQKLNNLKVTGKFDKATKKKLDEYA